MNSRQPLPKRLRPEPLPAIDPVPEYLADGELRAVYEDTKAVLGVPWMGVVAMAFARYPAFYRELWRGLRPVAASKPFQGACGRLAARAGAEAARLAPPPLGGRLRQEGYAPRELAEIRATAAIFERGNQPYLLMATMARLLLEGHALSDRRDAEGTDPPAPVSASLVLMEPHHADGPTRAVYADIRARLGLPFVNTDYRAFARWPSFFAAAWSGLRGHPGTVSYESAVGRLHDAAVEEALALPNLGGLEPQTIRTAAAEDAPGGEVPDVVRLFQWLLPGLTLNVAFIAAGLDG